MKNFKRSFGVVLSLFISLLFLPVVRAQGGLGSIIPPTLAGILGYFLSVIIGNILSPLYSACVYASCYTLMCPGIGTLSGFCSGLCMGIGNWLTFICPICWPLLVPSVCCVWPTIGGSYGLLTCGIGEILSPILPVDIIERLSGMVPILPCINGIIGGLGLEVALTPLRTCSNVLISCITLPCATGIGTVLMMPCAVLIMPCILATPLINCFGCAIMPIAIPLVDCIVSCMFCPPLINCLGCSVSTALSFWCPPLCCIYDCIFCSPLINCLGCAIMPIAIPLADCIVSCMFCSPLINCVGCAVMPMVPCVLPMYLPIIICSLIPSVIITAICPCQWINSITAGVGYSITEAISSVLCITPGGGGECSLSSLSGLCPLLKMG